MLLYHGSSKDIEKTLKPNKAFDREDYSSVVYLTNKKEFALLYAISPIDTYVKKHFNVDNHYSAISAHIFERNGLIKIMECYPNMFDDIYHQKAYIYVCNINETELNNTGTNEFAIDKEINFIEKIEIEDVYNELLALQQQGIVEMINYEDMIKHDDLDPWKYYFESEHIEYGLQYRASHCKTQKEIEFFQMVSKYFPSIKQYIKLK